MRRNKEKRLAQASFAPPARWMSWHQVSLASTMEEQLALGRLTS